MHPLASGTRFGRWRVQAFEGHGAFGAVYRAERVGFRHSEPGALKVSLLWWNGRMKREVELLTRLSHPGIPRLLDRGQPRPSSGDEYPYFVMEWVHGTPLYAWAEQSAPSPWQLYRVLAQLARALEAVHAIGGVHRDVKGDNVLVRLSDRSPVLIDFGSCHFHGAPRITWESLAPFTPEYLSPQAWLFELRLARDRDSYYPPSPADDLYALGVTAYRLVMGQYPPPLKAQRDEDGSWHVSCPNPRPLLEDSPRVEPRLREVILRLLSETPEARGTAAQIAQALEAVANEHREAPTPTSPVEKPQHSRIPERPRDLMPWLALAAAAGLAMVLWSLTWSLSVLSSPVSANSPGQAQAQPPDAGTAAVGDSAPAAPPSSPPPSGAQSVSQDDFIPDPKQPRRQAIPDAKGRCPGRKQVAFDGGCWMRQAPMTAEDCRAGGYTFLEGKCYAPVLELPQKAVPTSAPGDAR